VGLGSIPPVALFIATDLRNGQAAALCCLDWTRRGGTEMDAFQSCQQLISAIKMLDVAYDGSADRPPKNAVMAVRLAAIDLMRSVGTRDVEIADLLDQQDFDQLGEEIPGRHSWETR
jgi:hypothetical protein